MRNKKRCTRKKKILQGLFVELHDNEYCKVDGDDFVLCSLCFQKCPSPPPGPLLAQTVQTLALDDDGNYEDLQWLPVAIESGPEMPNCQAESEFQTLSFNPPPTPPTPIFC